jgi:hypothetical protein
MKHNLILAVIAGAVSCAVSAAIWAGVTIATEYQIGWMAVGVGFLVGYSVRFLGQGESMIYGVIGAFFAVMGCALGNLFSMLGFMAQAESLAMMDVITTFDYSLSFDVLTATFEPMDALFYGIALYEGFKFAIVAPEYATVSA